MAIEVKLPQWGMGMTEGTVIAWMKQEGDSVVEGEDLVEIETAKTQAFLVAPSSGILAKICVPIDETVPVGDVLAVINEIDEETVVENAAASVHSGEGQ
jgi:pyruvate/2-oxoglutarate dehydrogenase complex dihydrolipoamide acyltransferase (E2) component